MPPLTPTSREIVLLAVLLVLLLTFTTTLPQNKRTITDLVRPYAAKEDDSSASLGPATLESQYTLQSLNIPLRWGLGQVPETKVVVHVPGWTIFDRLYMLNGTIYVVSDHPETIPDRRRIISTASFIYNGPAAEAQRIPTDKELRIVSTNEARELFGEDAERLDGVTWYANDPKQFITHYFHWSAELFFGFWRTYSSLDPRIPPTGETSLPAPRRMMFSHLDADNWRDYSEMNQWVLRSSFPSISMEFMNDWKERVDMARPFVFDRVVFADRAAAMYGDNFLRTQRTAANAFALPGSVNWWSTIRNNVVSFAGLSQSGGAESVQGVASTPVITYISRQDWGRRMLIQEHHERLVEELHNLRSLYGYEVNIVNMDQLSRIEQFQLAGRTTIMMGVHGNGLTALLWMRPTPKSTVMEFFYPEGFAHDYEYTTRALGMIHYGFWNDKYFTRPDVPPVNYPEGFQGNEIPIDGAMVARLCRERLTLSEEADD
ncbi:uncharacterized protein LAESUDRAFT_711704 [Laetiporus sulphureus 93-53]|uniref:Glycosyltransferase 61 catalytic domain-containing protein n=1 Tax=Laetiporus sulphureus 93-53 TaxID=1314785 RepID=A0A165GMI9_9APHY|nr:uncharacterized protein LAESUDRAFT_711704 [Laetiporus sulphureus 93-53]KZT10556.1 hypothetical protein LAESUDRAFT_711704 [Laetiporus sulphureus 93-53]